MELIKNALYRDNGPFIFSANFDLIHLFSYEKYFKIFPRIVFMKHSLKRLSYKDSAARIYVKGNLL